ncbi:PAS domain S-box-containing protein [Neorhizobium galegae]|uniref:PAS domain-containing protein n=1 Tax=Neorhizobium galegae TaxID=399 RepID=UPI001EBE5175|nr:PAS domain-containing protein [Neorhizobium galegae]MBP2561913.1 PAS domain S-box-containing protein [Neorhizobium galegae]
MNTASRFPAERLQQVLDSAVDTGIIRLDVNGTITGWSKGAEALLGWSQDEMLGETLVAIFPPEGAAALLGAELAYARSKGKGSGEGWRLQKGGGRIWAVGETPR